MVQEKELLTQTISEFFFFIQLVFIFSVGIYKSLFLNKRN